jgi:hypothetical protein
MGPVRTQSTCPPRAATIPNHPGRRVGDRKQSDWTIIDRASAEDPLYVGGSTNRSFVRGGDWHENQ